MPHQCIECDRTFPDGSKEMLTGCPECGGNKFQFRPSGRSETLGGASAPPSDSPTPATDDTTTTGPTDDTTTTDPISSIDSTDPTDDTTTTDSIDPTDDTATTTDVSEDSAQASARTDVVTRDELDRVRGDTTTTERDDTTERDEPTDTSRRPGVDDLREELTDQFESIKILSPGQYELNLMELYDRQEYIISLREDGRYVIEMPGSWDDPE